MKHFTVPLLIATMLITLASCKKESTSSSVTPQDGVIPYLKVGNKWVYNITGGFTSYSTYTLEIVSNASGLYRMTTKFDTDAGSDAFEYFANGYLNTYDDGDKIAPDQAILKYLGSKVGDKWTRVTADETYYHELTAVNQSVTVPAGTFLCSVVKTTFKNAFNEQTTYWSDTYGEIKVDGLLLSTELASKNF